MGQAYVLDDILQAKPRALAKAISLLENKLPQQRQIAINLLDELLPHCGRALKIGITGIPGVGKSSFIETWGQQLLNQSKYKSLAVLSIDPSSPLAGGSIMGDKVRMTTLSQDPRVFIRPSPHTAARGGIAPATQACSLLLDAAGFDIVLIESVGTGQSEWDLADIVDILILMQMPSTGDAIQAIKRGVLELCDLILINKADGDLVDAAEQSASEHRQSVQCPVLKISTKAGNGLKEVHQEMEILTKQDFSAKRKAQQLLWFEREALLGFQEILKQSQVNKFKSQIRNGSISPPAAARQLIEAINL